MILDSGEHQPSRRKSVSLMLVMISSFSRKSEYIVETTQDYDNITVELHRSRTSPYQYVSCMYETHIPLFLRIMSRLL